MCRKEDSVCAFFAVVVVAVFCGGGAGGGVYMQYIKIQERKRGFGDGGGEVGWDAYIYTVYLIRRNVYIAGICGGGGGRWVGCIHIYSIFTKTKCIYSRFLWRGGGKVDGKYIYTIY